MLVIVSLLNTCGGCLRSLTGLDTMQVISSPTRREVNVAHAKSRWLDIGIPSTRNLRAISWGRVAMWTILGLSSVPLHLM